MSESQGRDLKPPEDGMFYENFGFGTFFWYHNFQHEIDAWESTVQRCQRKMICSQTVIGASGKKRFKRFQK